MGARTGLVRGTGQVETRDTDCIQSYHVLITSDSPLLVKLAQALRGSGVTPGLFVIPCVPIKLTFFGLWFGYALGLRSRTCTI